MDLRGEADACFPADATVMLRGGVRVRMSELALGDEVAVRRPDGALSWEPVYAFGHRDSVKTAEFVELQMVTPMDGGAEVVKAIQVRKRWGKSPALSMLANCRWPDAQAKMQWC